MRQFSSTHLFQNKKFLFYRYFIQSFRYYVIIKLIFQVLLFVAAYLLFSYFTKMVCIFNDIKSSETVHLIVLSHNLILNKQKNTQCVFLLSTQKQSISSCL